MIEVTNLVRRYGPHIAVDHANFKIEKGEIVGFLGPNGAGKSTTMNILTGYLSSTEGTVKIDGMDILAQSYYLTRDFYKAVEMYDRIIERTKDAKTKAQAQSVKEFIQDNM